MFSLGGQEHLIDVFAVLSYPFGHTNKHEQVAKLLAVEQSIALWASTSLAFSCFKQEYSIPCQAFPILLNCLHQVVMLYPNARPHYAAVDPVFPVGYDQFKAATHVHLLMGRACSEHCRAWRRSSVPPVSGTVLQDPSNFCLIDRVKVEQEPCLLSRWHVLMMGPPVVPALA